MPKCSATCLTSWSLQSGIKLISGYDDISAAMRLLFRGLPVVTKPTKPLIDCISGKFRIPTNSPQILLYVIWNFHRFV